MPGDILHQLSYHPEYDVVHAVANNPATSADTLEDLHKRLNSNNSTIPRPHSRLHKAIAHNPNTPLKILGTYLRAGHEDVFDNPMMPLHQLENPSYLSELLDTEGDAYNLANRGRHPELLRALNSHPSINVKAALLRNTNTPQDILNSYTFDTPERRSKYAQHIAGNQNASPEVISRIINAIPNNIKDHTGSDTSSLEEIVLRNDLNQQHFNALKQFIKKIPTLRKYAVSNEITPADVLSDVINNTSNGDVQYSAMRHSNITPELLHTMALRNMERYKKLKSESIRTLLINIRHKEKTSPETKELITKTLKNSEET